MFLITQNSQNLNTIIFLYYKARVGRISIKYKPQEIRTGARRLKNYPRFDWGGGCEWYYNYWCHVCIDKSKQKRSLYILKNQKKGGGSTPSIPFNHDIPWSQTRYTISLSPSCICSTPFIIMRTSSPAPPLS